MTDELDDELDEIDPAEAMAALRDQIRTEGARAAYQALLGVCRDKTAPAPARATAGTTLMRAAGLLEKREEKPQDPFDALSSSDLKKVIAGLEKTVGEAGPKSGASKPGGRVKRPAAKKPTDGALFD